MNKTINRLSESLIRQQFNSHNTHEPIQFKLFEHVESTQDFLKCQPPAAGVTVCCAEQQSKGRGRFGRSWHSPSGENIYCSIRLVLNCNMSQLSALSLVTSISIVSALHSLGLACSLLIKWPNDILWQGKKLSGNLIELISTSDTQTDLVIGVGINVNSDLSLQQHVDKPCCSLLDITGQRQMREPIIGQIIHHLLMDTERLVSQGFPSFLTQWQALDALFKQSIEVFTTPITTIKGIANGVDNTGRLILIDDAGHVHYLSSGETSLQNVPTSPIALG
jgi:BirA family biotin operon repressor/biotin-[acetyl-CoA-carboxylase] ligase